MSSGREGAPAGPSFLRAVQQLGHSCGQSVMAADLAAFVTHKQLLGGVVAVEAALQHSRPAVTSALPGALWVLCAVTCAICCVVVALCSVSRRIAVLQSPPQIVVVAQEQVKGGACCTPHA